MHSDENILHTTGGITIITLEEMQHLSNSYSNTQSVPVKTTKKVFSARPTTLHDSPESSEVFFVSEETTLNALVKYSLSDSIYPFNQG